MTNGQELANMKKMHSQIRAPGTDEFAEDGRRISPGRLPASCTAPAPGETQGELKRKAALTPRKCSEAKKS